MRPIRFYKLSLALGIAIIFILTACRHKTYTPKPRGYFRLDFPEKSYKPFHSDCHFSLEIPVYGEIGLVKKSYAEPCWYNINFKNAKATIYLTYKRLKGDLDAHIEDVRTIAYKHIVKADDIIESDINIPEHNVYGVLYDIKGNTASSVNFYVTDSTTDFLSGSLYFNVPPNKDSLAPAIEFFRSDIIHLIHTLHWD